MRVFLFAGAVSAVDWVPGVNPVNCGADYFRPGAEWPLESAANAGRTVRICQNRYGSPHYFATLFSVDDLIPVYSGGKFRRYSNQPTYSRPSSNWHHLLNGLCTELPDATTSFYGNLASVGSANYETCHNWQPIDEDYLGNNAEIKIDRGHLVPSAIMNQNEMAMKTTFTLTNVAPQSSNFNQRAWNQLECMVRTFMERDIDGEDAWIYIGTHGTKAWMNEDKPDKRNVRIPAAYWKAFCYTNGQTSYSWVYYQENENDQTQSSPDLFMSAETFSNTYYEGEPIFDEICQRPNTGYGPWYGLIMDWDEYLTRYSCK
ncbi:unnamed protein product [Oikopleura dioica]|uniref:Endonuclease n=1 Tax=Oikopleura dioica TaxID=34765 RepID=E4Y8C4_OIKDI|nr:unnamed protein product [Oikopleura dioica]